MKKPVLIAIVLLVSVAHMIYGQQSPVFSHYAFNKSYWNPALTAQDGISSVMLISRGQWVGYEPSFDEESAAPATQYFNYSSLNDIKGIPFGIGGTIIYDQLGPLSDIELDLSFAFHKDFSRGVLSFGLSPRFVNRILDASSLIAVNPDDIRVGGRISEMKIDLAAGVAYQANDYSVAIGLNNILRPDYDYALSDLAINTSSRENYELNLMVDYNYLLNQKTVLIPTLLLRSDFATWTYDIGLRAVYQKKAWLGLSYRASDAVSLFLGYSFLKDNDLKIGYSFDLIVDNQEAKQPTSHEIYLRYNIATLGLRSKKVVRTPRFRF